MESAVSAASDDGQDVPRGPWVYTLTRDKVDDSCDIVLLKLMYLNTLTQTMNVKSARTLLNWADQKPSVSNW